MPTYQGTPGNDVIDGRAVASPGDSIDAGAGDDQVVLGPAQTFVGGPGNDSVSGSDGQGEYALWHSPRAVQVDLARGVADDGYGGRDQLSGISTVHLPAAGGTVLGSDRNEQVFVFGGSNRLELGAGTDRVIYWQQDSAGFELVPVQGGVDVRNRSTGTVDSLRGVEEIVFADRSISPAFLTASVRAQFQYDVYSFVETQRAPSYTYAGQVYPGALLSWFPQAVFQLDINGDGVQDVILPMNKGYASGVDTRTPFLALSSAGSRLVLDPALNAQMPVTAGARRAEVVELAGGGTAVVTVAHDTGDGKLGDLQLLRTGPHALDASALVPTLPAALPGRPNAVNAHSLATGDLNGDGRTDILVGDWSSPGTYALLQGADGRFTVQRQAAYGSITEAWPMVNPGRGEGHNLLIDLAIVDVNGDGFGDIVAGWGHGSTSSYVFLNNRGEFSTANKIALPDSIYGIDNQMHLKTLAADFDGDGDQDMVVLWSRLVPYYAGNSLQLLRNDGKGGFTDVTTTQLEGASDDAFLERLEWSNSFQVVDVNGDGWLDIVGARIHLHTPVAFLNDGTGRFTRLEIPTDAFAGEPLSWGDFDGDGKLEYVTFTSGWQDAAGTSSLNRVSVFELDRVLGTGPGGIQAAEAGAAAFNEHYYLHAHADVQALVQAGRFSNGLAHYLAHGRAEGRVAIAAGSTVVGSAAAEEIVLREGGEQVRAGAGNDRITGLAGDDRIDGGEGLDTAVYRGGRAQHQVTETATGREVAGPEGRDTLLNVERLAFTDVHVAFDLEGNAGQAYRLYQAAFDRTPDLSGLGFQIRVLDSGWGLLDVAGNFLASPEFQATYGSLNDTDFVNQLYLNVLDRPADAEGLAYHVNRIASGVDRSYVLVGFSESPENQANVIGAIREGIAYGFA